MNLSTRSIVRGRRTRPDLRSRTSAGSPIDKYPNCVALIEASRRWLSIFARTPLIALSTMPNEILLLFGIVKDIL